MITISMKIKKRDHDSRRREQMMTIGKKVRKEIAKKNYFDRRQYQFQAYNIDIKKITYYQKSN